MKVTDFKKMIKEAVKEVFQEEMRDILLEAVRSPKVPIGAGSQGAITETRTTTGTISEASRQAFREMLGGNPFSMDQTNTFTTATPAYAPPPVNTAGEGSSLPPGEVGMDQIMNLLSK